MRICVLTAFLVLTNSAYAQDSGGDVQAAARAYEEGQLAQLQNDYARAARLFEIAHRAAPAAAAIRSAIRNHRAAGALPRAATLSIVAAMSYADDVETSELTVSVLTEASATLGRLDVSCDEPCSVSVDGHLVTLADGQELSVYVLPGSHELLARFATGEQASSFEVSAGASVARSVEAPAAAAVVEPEPINSLVEPEPIAVLPPEPEPSGLSPVVTYVGAGVTAALVGAFVWSLADTSGASDDYQANPTRVGFDDGRGRVLRTGILGAAAGVAGVATLIIAIAATNWDGNEDDDRASMPALMPSIWAHSEGGGLAVSGALGRTQ